jgi:hypothetical protein
VGEPFIKNSRGQKALPKHTEIDEKIFFNQPLSRHPRTHDKIYLILLGFSVM